MLISIFPTVSRCQYYRRWVLSDVQKHYLKDTCLIYLVWTFWFEKICGSFFHAWATSSFRERGTFFCTSSFPNNSDNSFMFFTSLSSVPYSFAGLDKMRGRWRACMQRGRKEVFARANLRARKSVKTLLSSTRMLFKEASCFYVWKQIIQHNKI